MKLMHGLVRAIMGVLQNKKNFNYFYHLQKTPNLFRRKLSLKLLDTNLKIVFVQASLSSY